MENKLITLLDSDNSKLSIKNQVRLNRKLGIELPAFNKKGKPICASVWAPSNNQLKEYNIVPFYKSIDFLGRTFPYVVRKLIWLYSKEGDLVYDPMLGTGTTLYEAIKLGRKVKGSDISTDQITSFKLRWKKFVNNKIPEVCVCNAESLSHLKDNKIDLIIMSFPWFNTWKFSKNIKRMEGTNNFDTFLEQSYRIYKECKRVIKKGGFICNILGNTTAKNKFIPVGMSMPKVIERAGLDIHYQFWNLRCPPDFLIDPWLRSALEEPKGKNKADYQIGWDVHEDIIIARKD